MKIRVDEVRTGEDGAREVSFSTAVGDAAGRWAGRTIEPVVGRQYGVEFTIETRWVLGSTVSLSEARRPSLTRDGAGVLLTGEVESVDEGVLYFRLAPDSLTLLDAPDVAVAAGSWITLRVDARALQLFAHDQY